MSTPPSVTPPALVRTVTHEDLARGLSELRAWRSDDYTTLRNLESRIEANHLSVMHQLGELARILRSR